MLLQCESCDACLHVRCGDSFAGKAGCRADNPGERVSRAGLVDEDGADVALHEFETTVRELALE